MSPEPELVIDGHLAHQKASLFYGLSQFDPSDLVLKTRTDGADLNFDLEGTIEDFEQAAPPSEHSPYKRKMTVLYYSPFAPYFFGDQTILGQQQDLMHLASPDMWYLLEQVHLNPEQMLHSAAFVHRRRYLKDFFRINPGLAYNKVPLAEKMYEEMLRDDFFREAILIGLEDALDSYVVGFNRWTKGRVELQWPVDVTLNDLAQKSMVQQCNALHFNDVAATCNTGRREVLQQILELQISRDDRRTLREAVKTEWRTPPRPPSAALHPPAAALATKLSRLSRELPTAPPPFVDGAVVQYGKARSMIRK